MKNALSLTAVIKRLHEGKDLDESIEIWLTSIVKFAAENQPEILDDLLRLKLEVARRLHYLVTS